MPYVGQTITDVFPTSISVDSATISGNTTVGGTLGVTGVSTLSDNIVFDASSKGVHLGVTSATASNLLDDYEEGTWTPTYVFNGGGTVTTTTNDGKYVKIGSLVQASFKIRSTGVSGVSGTLQINGLPFSISSEERSGGSVAFMRNWGADMPNFRLYPVQNTQVIYMYYNATNATTSQVGTGQFSTGSDSNVLEAHVIYQI